MDSIKSHLAGGVAAFKSINWRNALTAPLIIAWLVGGVFSVIIPVSHWTREKNSYYSSYGYYIEAENQQREYEEGNNGNNNNNNNNGNGNYYYEECSWWNWKCRKAQYEYAMYDNNDNNNNGQVTLPSWYILMGGQTEEMRRWEEENTGRRGGATGPTAGEKFVYIWMVLMFVGILIYGTYVLAKKVRKTPLVVTVLLYAQFCLVTLIMASQGVISSDDREFEDSIYGWYGQMGVLIAYQSFWFMLFSVIFAIVFGVMAILERRRLNKEGIESDSANNVEMSSSTASTGFVAMGETAPAV